MLKAVEPWRSHKEDDQEKEPNFTVAVLTVGTVNFALSLLLLRCANQALWNEEIVKTFRKAVYQMFHEVMRAVLEKPLTDSLV